MEPAAARRIDALLALPRSAKKTLAVLADSALCVLTVWLAICFRFESWVSLSGYQWLAVILSIALAIPLLTAFGFYHTVIRYVGRQTITAALRAIGMYAVIYSAVFTAYGFPLVPRTIGVLQPLLLLIGLALLRLMASQLLGEQAIHSAHSEQLPGVLIYGAGNSGQQLAASLKTSGSTQIVGFLDDNVGVQGAYIGGIPVYAPENAQKLIKERRVRDVLLALPSIGRSRRNEILKLFSGNDVGIRTLPSLTDLIEGKVSETDLRELDIEDLLGRDPVAPVQELLSKTTAGKVVLVTGAGGSIGSELCRQIFRQSPKHLVLLDVSEFALYQISSELAELSEQLQLPSAPILTSLLANVRDEIHIQKILDLYRPNTIYHAAAYKHVPLVESNPNEGLKNNVLGTVNVARASIAAGVQDMVLISTDKAVRPTNVMGASKRLAELCLQCLSHLQVNDTKQTTRFCIVRFGNVLGSSGSVVPKFREQIRTGGPITLTHPDITRYFMTIPEAAQLVIQASGLHAGQNQVCQTYLLDMGASVRVQDLAKVMIQLSGLTLKDELHPEGDIAIEIRGLRPGEKLYEELLIAGNPVTTSHPKIMSSQESLHGDTQEQLNGILHFCDELTDFYSLKQALIALNIGYQIPLHAAIEKKVQDSAT